MIDSRVAGPPWTKWLRRLVTVCAWAYPATVLLALLLLRFSGERWWVTAVALYVPRKFFAIPLLPIVLALLLQRRFRLLAAPVVAGFLVLFPLMGLVLPGWRRAAPDGPRLRVLSINADSANEGASVLLAAVDRYAPDVVMMQEISLSPSHPLLRGLSLRYPTVHASSQFIVASRFPLTPTKESDLPRHNRIGYPARFERYVVEAPFGSIALYNVHFISPREAFYRARGHGLRNEILSGRLFASGGPGPIQANSKERALEAEDVGTSSRAEKLPVLIAGDTNLPGLSPALAAMARGRVDGFREAGGGFGYTFPASDPWMRIDRMLASEPLRFVRFDVGCPGASDHLCIIAEIANAPH
jgi:vancomycin resistance protein VanJ